MIRFGRGGSSPGSGGSGARTFFYFGDGTAGTIALPTGVTTHPTDKPGAYVQGGRAYWFGAVVIDLSTTAGAHVADLTDPLINLPGGLVPSALEMPSDAGLVGIGQVWAAAASGTGWQVGFYVLNESLFLTVPGITLADTGSPTFPTTGELQVFLTPLTWDIQGSTPI